MSASLQQPSSPAPGSYRELRDAVSFAAEVSGDAPDQTLHLMPSGEWLLVSAAATGDRSDELLSPGQAHAWLSKRVGAATPKDPVRQAQAARAAADSVPFWWHSIDLGGGVTSPGRKSAELLAGEVEGMRLPDLQGRSVLDIGAWDGYFSFEAERLGASRVVALDHFVWCTEHGANNFVGPLETQIAENLAAGYTPGKVGFDAAHRLRGSRVESVVADFMSCDLGEVGRFDVVFFLGVLYHMENPLEAMRRLASVTGEVAIIESEAIAMHGFEGQRLAQFCAGTELGDDPTNWWSPNAKAIEGLALEAGFSRVECLNPPNVDQLEPGRVHRYRSVFHAYR